jgi:glycosyltransferase involved in cell wall biosynthesis
VKAAVVSARINLETGGGSHYSLLLYTAGLRELGTDVEVYSLKRPSPATAAHFAAAGVPLHDLDGLPPAAQVDRLGTMPGDVLMTDDPLPLAYQVKRAHPRRRVAAHLNTLSGFCTEPGHQQRGCWLTCRHWDRVRHHPGGAARRLKYLVKGAATVADLAAGFRSLDGCVFPSPPTAEAYRVYRLDPARCFVVPECLDVDHITRFRAAPFASSGGPLTVLYIGTLARYKGLGLLCEALRRVRGPWRARIYGDGEDRGRVLDFAREFPDRVDYRGHVTNRDLFAELHGGDFLFVHPCLWFEALGRGILEAMALGIPVVVPDVGGPSWSVTPEKTGLHYRHRDVADLVRCIEWAAAHPEEMRAIGEAGREAARQYDYRLVSQAWRDTLAAIAGGSPARGIVAR